MKQKLAIFIILYFVICFLFTKPAFAEFFYQNDELVEKAKLEIKKWFPNVSLENLEYLKNQSGSRSERGKNHIRKYFSRYFIFRDTSTIYEDNFDALVIRHFDLYFVGIFSDGSFPVDVNHKPKKMFSSSAFSKIKAEEHKFSLNLFDVPIKDFIIVSKSLAAREIKQYIGPNFKLNCFTEKDYGITKEQMIIFYQRTLEIRDIEIITTDNQTTKAIYKNN